MTTMREATPEDTDAIADIKLRALRGPLAIWLNDDNPATCAETQRTTRNALERANQYVLAHDGTVVGYLSFSTEVPRSDTETIDPTDNHDLLIFREKRKCINDGIRLARPTFPHLYLEYLLIHPSFQNQGLGRRLLAYTIEQARTLELPVYLESSLLAYPYYLKHGFRDHGTVNVIHDGRLIGSLPTLISTK